MYLSGSTRPDISYAVGNFAKFCSKPAKDHWTALKRVLRYLKGTVEHGKGSVLVSLMLTGLET